VNILWCDGNLPRRRASPPSLFLIIILLGVRDTRAWKTCAESLDKAIVRCLRTWPGLEARCDLTPIFRYESDVFNDSGSNTPLSRRRRCIQTYCRYSLRRRTQRETVKPRPLDMSTPLLLQGIPGIDADPLSLDGRCGGGVGKAWRGLLRLSIYIAAHVNRFR